MEGWIKVHRHIMENEYYFSEKFTKVQAWIDVLLLATHKERTVLIRGIELNLKPGQLCYSQKSLASRWKWNVKTVNKYLNSLKKREMVDTRKTNITTIISIKKWFLYQTDGEQNTYQKGEQKDTKTETNKNVKNILIELAKPIIERIEKEKSLYSVIGKYNNSLGAERLTKILADCKARGVIFSTEAKLSAYLQVCSKNNGKVTDSIPEIKEGVETWMQ